MSGMNIVLPRDFLRWVYEKLMNYANFENCKYFFMLYSHNELLKNMVIDLKIMQSLRYLFITLIVLFIPYRIPKVTIFFQIIFPNVEWILKIQITFIDACSWPL